MRLCDPREFRRIKEQGLRRVAGSMIANWLPLPEGSGSQLGIITGRRMGASVERNRARRLLREAFRLHQHDLARPVALVLIARRSIVEQNGPAVAGNLLRILNQAGLLRKP